MVVANEAVENRLKAFLCLELVGPALARNDRPTATEFIAEGRRWAGELSDADITISVCKAAARLALAEGDLGVAERHIALAAFTAHNHGRPIEVVEALRWQAALLTGLGATDWAVGCVRVAWQAAQAGKQRTVESSVLLDLMSLAARKNDSNLLAETLRRLLELQDDRAE